MPTLQTPGYAAHEKKVADYLAQRWHARAYSMGAYAPLDWYFERADKVVAVAELKMRNVEWAKYPSIFLSHNKWCALMFAYHYNEVEALFVVQARDALMYVPVIEVPANPIVMRSRIPPRPTAPHDRAPVLEVATRLFRSAGPGVPPTDLSILGTGYAANGR